VALSSHHDRMMLMLDPTPLARGLVRKKVEVVNCPEGASRFSSRECRSASLFDKIQTVQLGTCTAEMSLGQSVRIAGCGGRRAAVHRPQRGHDVVGLLGLP
jgi:hypothetical protein